MVITLVKDLVRIDYFHWQPLQFAAQAEPESQVFFIAIFEIAF